MKTPFVLALLLSATSAFSADQATLQYASTPQTFRLDGEKKSTIYRTETYIGTCYRTESYPDTRSVCTTHSSPESCSDSVSCSNVSRPVCSGSGGCTDYSTRECTTSTSCSGGGSYQTCHDESYTATREVPYSCEMTRQVPIGTKTDAIYNAEVQVTFKGQIAGAGNTFNISVANGLDISRETLLLTATKTDGKALFFAKRLNMSETAGTAALHTDIKAAYEIEVLDLDQAAGLFGVLMQKMSFKRDSVVAEFARNEEIPVSLHLTIKKDRLIGGLKTVFAMPVPESAVTYEKLANGLTRATVSFAAMGGISFNRRPHVATLVVNSNPTGTEQFAGLMNRQDMEKIQKKMRSSKAIRRKM